MTRIGANDDRADRLEAYLDGSLTGDSLREFEEEMSRDRLLRDEIELQRRIDGSLRRTFLPAPSMDAPLNGGAHGGERSLLRRIGLPFGIAAAVLIAGGLAWKATTDWLRPKGELERLWAREVASDFDVMWACESDEEFIEATVDTFGQPMLAPSSGGARIVGWDYVPETMDARIGMLIAESEEGRSIILGERIPGSRAIKLDTQSRLSLFERRVGDVMLYELTARDHPTAIELFTLIKTDE